jgi:crossover junction endodeoxyribonuclease RuvC
MPVLKSGGAKGKSEVDRTALARVIDASSTSITHCFLEQVGVRPGEGTVGAFSFGKGYGMLLGILAANFVPLSLITPAVWKKAMQCPGDKDQARARASDVLPRHADKWLRKKDDGRAEAALLAVYGARQLAIQTLTAA